MVNDNVSEMSQGAPSSSILCLPITTAYRMGLLIRILQHTRCTAQSRSNGRIIYLDIPIHRNN